MTVKDDGITKVEVKPDVPKEVPQKIGPARGGTMKRTLKELEMLGIELKDLFSVKGMTINLSWSKAIKLINFNADKEVLNWKHTFEEALEIIEIFLF